jgi:RelA/SpoT family (p)ppGpp synthetase
MGANYANLFEVIAGDVSASDDKTRISELCSELEVYLEPAQVQEIYQAYLVGAEAHEGQSRVSGEPYISHPVAVARILAEMRMDSKSIIAAILHDVIEDTPTAKEQIAEQFGEEVAELVDGVSKLTQIDFRSKAEAQAENFRKMMLAMVKDIRVIIIKLADRLHNMRTLDAMRPDKRRRIAQETMDIYAPIANRLGIFKMRHELLDLSIKAAYPMRYRAIDSACKEVVGYRKEIFNTIEAAIKQRLKETNIEAAVKYRQKNIHSIYRKMKEKKLSFKEITDVFGVRILTQSVDDCYRVLGVMHNLYKPLPGRFKDYLAIPKTNGYQSLHSSLFGPHGVAIEVQIRTEEMDHFAESGIAAHWITRKARPVPQAHRAERSSGSRTCWKCSRSRVARRSSLKASRSTCFRTKFTSLRPRAISRSYRAAPPWSISPTRCMSRPASITRCRRSAAASTTARPSKSSVRKPAGPIRAGSTLSIPRRRAPISAIF